MPVYDYTKRIAELGTLDTLADNDEIIIVDKSDLSGTPNGTDKKVIPRTIVEQANVRPANNLTVSKKLTEWLGDFNQAITSVQEKVQDATTTQKGISRLASDSEAIAQVSSTTSLTPANLASMGATEERTGLVKLLSSSDLLTNMTNDRLAVTASTLFAGLFSDSIFGTDSFVFRIPTKNSDDDTVTHLTVQYGQREINSVASTNRPESNFNHIHPFIDIGVTFPQEFENRCLMVIPMGYNVNSVYEEGTEFVYRELTSTIATATIRASRIEGDNTTGERIGVKYIAIGY
jgi:hypothetical protein